MSGQLHIIQKIHNRVFEKFQYKFDLELFGVTEKWVMPDSSFTGTTPIVGDCEDFALACRKLCRDIGIQTRLVVCLTEDNEGHCVLEALNGYILDNRQRDVVTQDWLADKGYTWVAISGYESGDDWHKIENKS